MPDNSDTTRYYNDNSTVFFEETVCADVTPLYERFLKYVPEGGKILDLGCGSGRDVKAFRDRGYVADGVDRSEELCKLASEYTGVKIKQMDFAQLDAVAEYDAIWACASLLHVPCEELPKIIELARRALKPSGVMYMSYKYGDYEGDRDGRFFNDMTEEKFADVFAGTDGLTLVEEWYSEDVRRGKDVKWYNVILSKESYE